MRAQKSSPEALERRETIGILLRDNTLTLGAIAKQVGITRERVRQIQHRHFPEHSRPRGCPRKGPPRWRSIKRDLLRIIRSSGAQWCAACCQAKPLDQFSPASQKGGRRCRKCNTLRGRRNYQENPNTREYCRRYRQAHRAEIREYQQTWRDKTTGETRAQTSKYRYLEKHAPLLADDVRHGELTLDEALWKFRSSQNKAYLTQVAVSVQGFLRSIRRHLTPPERAELKEQL